MRMLQGFDEATLVAARAAASKMAFITKNGTGTEYKGPNADGGGKYMDAEPGSIEELPEGMGVEVIDWNQPNPNYDPFVKACVRGMANGLLVSYPNLGNDYGEVNFSSGRMARMEETEIWKMVQCLISSDFCEPIFGKWLEMALLSGAIVSPSGKALPASRLKKFNEPYFHGRRWGWVDPTKEVAAISESLRLKLTSWTRELSILGIDRDELLDEIADDKKAAEERGITLPDEAELAAAAQRISEQEEKEKKDAEDDADETPAVNGNRLHLNGHAK
jgi:lambda family phage portal protein